MASIELKNIWKKYGEVVACREITWKCEDGEFFSLLGPSGCGKSSTMRMIAGLEEITSGEMYFGDRLVNALPPRDRNVAMVFENWALYPNMSVFDNIAFPLWVRDMPKDEIEKKVESKLAEQFWLGTGEIFYKDIDPKIMVEPLIGGDRLPLDFKFFMFGDKVGAIIVNSMREEGVRMNWYDEKWNRLDVMLGEGYPTNPAMDERPEGLDEMLRIAKILGKPFPAVRVDLYWVGGQAWFSELTFTTGKGMMRYEPQKFDFELGRLWDWSRPFVPPSIASKPLSPDKS